MARTVAAIQADLDLYHALLTSAGSTGIAEYTLDSGQGRQTVKRYTLAEIREAIRYFEDELLEVSDDGVVSMVYKRPL